MPRITASIWLYNSNTQKQGLIHLTWQMDVRVLTDKSTLCHHSITTQRYRKSPLSGNEKIRPQHYRYFYRTRRRNFLIM